MPGGRRYTPNVFKSWRWNLANLLQYASISVIGYLLMNKLSILCIIYEPSSTERKDRSSLSWQLIMMTTH